MSFRGVFIAVVLSTAMIVSAFMLQSRRPRIEVNRTTAGPGRGHRQVRRVPPPRDLGGGARVRDEPAQRRGRELPRLPSALQGAGAAGPQGLHHHQEAVAPPIAWAAIPTSTSSTCESRHAAPAWAAVTGKQDFTAEQVAFAEKIHKGAVDRPPTS